jgi:adenosine deaminase CECR1
LKFEMMSATQPIPEWEVELGVPQVTDPFIQKYIEGRDALIDQEKSSRSDRHFRASLTPLARSACEIVARIRAHEHRTIWVPDTQMGGHVFPGMPFALAKERMEGSKLWKIVSKLPKGALLHAHFDAMIDIDWLVEQALKMDGMAFWKSEEGSGKEIDWDEVKIGFRYMGKHWKKRSPSVWDAQYINDTPVPASEAAETYPHGGRKGFKKWLLKRCSITPGESLNHHHGLDAIWKKFGSCFPIINSILNHEPIFRAALQRLLRELFDDGIGWVDFRAAFIFQYYREGQTEPEEDYDAYFKAFQEEVAKFKDAEPQFWGARFIWTTLRSFSKQQIVENMELCIETKQKFPELISGFDLVGQEDLGRPLVDLLPEIFWFRKVCAEEGVEIPFFFHAGECLGDGDETDQNLFDAILLGTRRIGHGYSLYKHPLLIENVKQKSILIESCPISNEILRLTNNISSHPLPALLSRGVHVALCNDDPAILGHGKNGLTHDFWQALQAWQNLGLEGLGSLAENSVRYAAYYPDQSAAVWRKDVKDGIFGQGVRAERMREWTGEWNKFCEWIVMEYAADFGSDDDDDAGNA